MRAGYRLKETFPCAARQRLVAVKQPACAERQLLLYRCFVWIRCTPPCDVSSSRTQPLLPQKHRALVKNPGRGPTDKSASSLRNDQWPCAPANQSSSKPCSTRTAKFWPHQSTPIDRCAAAFLTYRGATLYYYACSHGFNFRTRFSRICSRPFRSAACRLLLVESPTLPLSGATRFNADQSFPL